MRRRRTPAVIAVLAMVVGLVALTPPQGAEAASAADFSPGNLISDANFFDGRAMTSSQVQVFIDQKHPGCASGATCLDTYAQSTPSIPADRYCGAYQGVARETAASIIARVGQACDISQRALLVLLEKEQSLVTHPNPSASRYTKATGFGCPDTAPCDPTVGGFFYQVYYGARQFQRYAAHPESYNHRAGVVNQILFNPNAACGRSAVRIENQATAGLYNYTPYQPNAAALRNLYGTGDSCSAYGNRNFWRLYTDWFGDPRGTGSGPSVGSVDAGATTRGLEATVSGWAFDPDTTSPVRIHVYANNPYPTGRNSGTLVADQARSGIPVRTPGGGNRFGFSGTVQVPSGTTRLCLHALDNTGHGNTMIGCVPVTPIAGSPFGTLESPQIVGSTATLRGWAHDPDSTAPLRVHVYRGGELGTGRPFSAHDADLPRPDIDASVPTAGPAHGFAAQVPIAAGGDRYCAYAINVGGGEHRLIGCQDLTRRTGSPFGSFEGVLPGAGAGQVIAAGWALDPDTAASVDVRVSVDGRTVGTYPANGSRPEVDRANPGYGAAHGFRVTLRLAAGDHQVCVTALDRAGGQAATALGCRTATVAGSAALPAPDRLAGANRYSTSVAISKAAFPRTAPVVYLASGTSFPDGLSAGPAAAHQGGPVLLTPREAVPADVLAEIRRLAPRQIVIVGGDPSVSAAAEAQVRGLAREVVRLGGANRFETSRMIAEHAFDDADAVLLATGRRFPDALAAGPAAAHLGGPVLLVDGAAATTDAATRSTLAGLGAGYVGIVGDASSVSAGIETATRAAGARVERFAGANRFETAAELGSLFGTAPRAFVASGASFADALPGAAAAGALGAPLLLSQSSCMPVPTRDRLIAWGPSRVTLLGGTPSLSQAVAAYRTCG